MFRQLYKLATNRYIHTTPILRNKTYTDTHEWLLKTNDYTKIGLSKHAVEEMTEIVYIEFVDHETEFKKNDDIVILESVKAVAEVKAPFDCSLVEFNTNLETNLDILNENPECEDNSWVVKIKSL